jgi:tRNA (guanine-N7-)-methyltransferase
MADQPGFINQLAPQTYRHYLEGYPVSKYMRRFMDMGQPIYYVHYRKA